MTSHDEECKGYDGNLCERFSFIQNLGERMNLNAEEISNALTAYECWMIDDPLKIPGVHSMGNGISKFFKIMFSHPKWRIFSVIAQSLLACPASEAACERGFSHLRQANGAERRRQKHDIIKARLMLISSETQL